MSEVRPRMINEVGNIVFIFKLKPKNNDEILSDEYWILSIQETLNQFKRNKKWKLVPRPKGYSIIGTK
jgi:hypothetical protein